MTASSAVAISQIQTRHRGVRASQPLANRCVRYRTDAYCAIPDNDSPNQLMHRGLPLAAKRIGAQLKVNKGAIYSSNITCQGTRSNSALGAFIRARQWVRGDYKFKL
jgi:hypothetical protein